MRSVYDLFELIGKNMKVIRKERCNISQEKLAENIGMSRSFLSHVESPNVDTGISLNTLFEFAQKYNIDIRDFFDGYENLMDKDNNDN